MRNRYILYAVGRMTTKEEDAKIVFNLIANEQRRPRAWRWPGSLSKKERKHQWKAS